MEIILLQDVKSLGKKGEIVNVSDGYARNFILKKNKGVEANGKNLNDLKLKKANDDKIAQQQYEDAQELGKKIEAGKIEVAIKMGEGGGRGSKRDEMKELIKEFRKQGDIIEKNIFRSVHNVNLRTIIGYHKDDMEYNFLDDYNERGK